MYKSMFIKFTNLCFHIFKVIIGKYTGTKIKNLSTVNRHVYSRKTQAKGRTIVHQSCSLYTNNQIMKHILEVTHTHTHLMALCPGEQGPER